MQAMKQIKVSLPDDLRLQLEDAAAKAGRSLSEEVRERVALPESVRAHVEAAANKAGHSIAEEIGRRLERTFRDDARDPDTRKLTDTIGLLAHLVKIQTGHSWFDHPGATSVMKFAIDSCLARTKGGDGKAVFGADELPPTEKRYLAVLSDDPQVMGSILAGIAHFWVVRRAFGREIVRNMTEEEVRRQIAEENT
jgi:hypothetical protein